MGITGYGWSHKNDYFHILGIIMNNHEWSFEFVNLCIIYNNYHIYIGKAKCWNKNTRQCIIGEEMIPAMSWGFRSHRLRDPQGHCILKGILYFISPLPGSKRLTLYVRLEFGACTHRTRAAWSLIAYDGCIRLWCSYGNNGVWVVTQK